MVPGHVERRAVNLVSSADLIRSSLAFALLAALVVDPAYVVDPVYPSQWVQEVLKLAQDPGVPQYVVIVLVVEAVVGVVVG